VMMSDASDADRAGDGEGRSRLLVSVLVDPDSVDTVARVIDPPAGGWTPVGPTLELPGGLRIVMAPNVDHETAGLWWEALATGATRVDAWHEVQAKIRHIGFPGWVGGDR